MKTEKNENENENARHTPGPWRVSAHDDNGDIVVRDYNMGAIVANCSEEFYGDITPKEQSANARLIAAAPDMLAALEAARLWAVEYYGPLPWLESAEAAIAKARNG